MGERARLLTRSVPAAAGFVLLLVAAAVAGPLDGPGATKALGCSACHGQGGNSRTAATPVLAGMPTWYFKKAIDDYASGRRLSPEMEPFAKMVRQLGVDDVAAYFAAQPRETLKVEIDREAAARGRKAAAACAACHGDDGYGDERRGVPSLRGQPRAYLRNQLRLFKTDRRSPGEPALVGVKAILKSLDDATLAGLAAYYASLGR